MYKCLQLGSEMNIMKANRCEWMGSIDYLGKPPIHFLMGFDISKLGFTTVIVDSLL